MIEDGCYKAHLDAGVTIRRLHYPLRTLEIIAPEPRCLIDVENFLLFNLSRFSPVEDITVTLYIFVEKTRSSIKRPLSMVK